MHKITLVIGLIVIITTLGTLGYIAYTLIRDKLLEIRKKKESGIETILRGKSFILEEEDVTKVLTFIDYRTYQENLIESINGAIESQEQELVNELCTKYGIDGINIDSNILPIARVK